MNRIVRDYHFSPARNATLAELVSRPRENQAKGRIPYERGAMIAFWLDDQIRQKSAGRFSLDAAMRDLFAERKRHPDLSKDRIIAAVARYLDRSATDQLRGYIETGATVEAPPTIRANCANRQMIEMHGFELGMDRTALIETKRVTALKAGSAAERSGLREGDLVTGISVYWNDTTKPVKLRLGNGREIEYLPIGPSFGAIARYSCP